MSSRTDLLTRKLAAAVRRQQSALNELSTVLTGKHEPGERERLTVLLQRCMGEYERLNEELKLAQLDLREIPGKRRVRPSGKTLREQALDILDEIGVPMSPTAIGEFATATTGVTLAASRFASLRRDDERAARRDPLARPAWLTPALSWNTLGAVARLLTSSAWPAERRLIGPRTPRVNHLRALLAYIRRYEVLTTTDSRRAELLLEGLIWRHARAVPGATKPGEPPNLAQVRDTIEKELSFIEPEDEAERKDAAARLQDLSTPFQLWGRPTLVDGDAVSGMRA